MFICVKCTREMRCDKNSVGVDYGHGHVYAGDRFVCDTCGHLMINTNGCPNHDPEYNQQDEYLKMPEPPRA